MMTSHFSFFFKNSANTAMVQRVGKRLANAVELYLKQNGFMLVYGDIDVNCTFSSLVSEKRDELFDELNKLLFN